VRAKTANFDSKAKSMSYRTVMLCTFDLMFEIVHG
jgi:hypothetical protein